MAVRNSSELGPILNKIAMYLAKDQQLCRYLVYSDKEPLNETKHQDVNGYNLLNKNILIVPEVNASEFDTAAKICMLIDSGQVIASNDEFKSIHIEVLVYVPLKSWIINDEQLRPFAIIGKIEEDLKGKKIQSLGKCRYDGFNYYAVDDNIGCYSLSFNFDVFN